MDLIDLANSFDHSRCKTFFVPKTKNHIQEGRFSVATTHPQTDGSKKGIGSYNTYGVPETHGSSDFTQN
jgi:hypothetical protein